MTPRVLFVARDSYRLPLSPSLARKWDALSERMSLRVLANGTGSTPASCSGRRQRSTDPASTHPCPPGLRTSSAASGPTS